MKTLKHIPLTPFKGGISFAIAFLLGMGMGQNAHADLKDGLVAHWSFDDCSATDNSGNGHDGISNGLSCEKTLSGQGAKFTRTSGNRVQLPYSSGMPTSGTIALQLKVDSAYQYRNYELSTTEQCALVFTTDVGGGDVTYPGSSWFHVCNNGDISVTVSTTKYGSNPAQTLVAKSTKFRFGDLHTVSFSFGLGGQVISVDGEVVATNLQNTQELVAGGTQDSAIDTPTLGEAVPGFWQNNQWDGGFEGVVDSFRIYNRTLTEAEVMELYNGKTELTYTPEPDPTPIIGKMPDPKLEASGTVASKTKISWEIPAYNNCNENRFNSKTSTLTSEICYNNIQGATVSVMPVGTSKSKMIVSVNPTNQTGSYFFKATFPSELKISPLTTLNLQQLSEDDGDEVAEVLSIIGDEVMGQIFGKLNFPLQLLTRTSVAGDPPFLNLLAARKGNGSILSKQLYPYQTIEYHLERKTENVAMMFVFQSDVSFSTFKKLLDKHGVSFYFGSDRAHELLIEKLKSK